MAVHEVVGTQHAPARARLRLHSFGGADDELLERMRTMERRPSNSEATLLEQVRPALRMASKHEGAFIYQHCVYRTGETSRWVLSSSSFT